MEKSGTPIMSKSLSGTIKLDSSQTLKLVATHAITIDLTFRVI